MQVKGTILKNKLPETCDLVKKTLKLPNVNFNTQKHLTF